MSIGRWLRRVICDLRGHPAPVFAVLDEEMTIILRCTRCGMVQSYQQQEIILSSKVRHAFRGNTSLRFRYGVVLEMNLPRARLDLLLQRVPLRTLLQR